MTAVRRGTKHVAKRPEPEKPKQTLDITDLTGVVSELRKITALLERLVPPRRQTLDELDPPAPGHLIGPSTEPGGAEEFISGQWHRRAGDVYARVALPGSPNAGDTDAKTS